MGGIEPAATTSTEETRSTHLIHSFWQLIFIWSLFRMEKQAIEIYINLHVNSATKNGGLVAK